MDHNESADNARKYLDRIEAGPGAGTAESLAAMANAYATLAVAEELRRANRIATAIYLGDPGEVSRLRDGLK